MTRFNGRLGGGGFLSASVLCVGVAILGRPAAGQLATWVGGATGSYDDPANWSGQVVPDTWTGGGVAAARITSTVPEIVLDTTYHTLDSLAGSGLYHQGGVEGFWFATVDRPTVRAEHDLSVRIYADETNVVLNDGADFYHLDGASVRSVTVRSESARPWLVPRYVLASDTPGGTTHLATWMRWTAAEASGEVDDFGQPWPISPLRIEADGPAASNAQLSLGGVNTIEGGTQVGVPIRVGGGTTRVGEAVLERDVSVAPTAELVLEQVDAGVTAFAGGSLVSFDPGARLGLGFTGAGGAVPFAQLDIAASNPVGIKGRLSVEALVDVASRFDVVDDGVFKEYGQAEAYRFIDMSTRRSEPGDLVVTYGPGHVASGGALLPDNFQGRAALDAQGVVGSDGAGPVRTGGKVWWIYHLDADGGLDLTPAPGLAPGVAPATVYAEHLTVRGGMIQGGHIDQATDRYFNGGTDNQAGSSLSLINAGIAADSTVDAYGAIHIEGGLELDGLLRVGRQNHNTNDGDLVFSGTQTLSGGGVLEVGDALGNGLMTQATLKVQNGDLTIGQDATVRFLGSGPIIAVDPLHSLIVHGTIETHIPANANANINAIAADHFELHGQLRVSPQGGALGANALDVETFVMSSGAVLEAYAAASTSITGDADLAGTLLLRVEPDDFVPDGFGGGEYVTVIPSAGAEYLVLTADTLAGRFDQLLAPGAMVDAGLTWVPRYEAAGPMGSLYVTAALIGDANLSGQIEQGDLDAVLQNWGKTFAADGVDWASGDLNGNGQVEQGDLDAVLQHWGSTAAPHFAGFSGGNVPEPGSAALITLGSLCGLCRRSGQRPAQR